MVFAAMSGQEGHRAPSDLAEEHGVARWAVRGLDCDLCHIVEEGIQPRPADDAYLGLRVAALRHAGHPSGVPRRQNPTVCRRTAKPPPPRQEGAGADAYATYDRRRPVRPPWSCSCCSTTTLTRSRRPRTKR